MTILVFGIHPDDVELGCGGSVCVATAQGHDVVIVDLTDGSSSSNGTVEERQQEATSASVIMGVRERDNLGMPDTGVNGQDPNQALTVVRTLRRFRPDVVWAPSADDPHPDHAEGGLLLQKALYLSGIHGYDTSTAAWKPGDVWTYGGRREVTPDLVVDITAELSRKMEAVRAHKSQFSSGKRRKPTPLNAADFLEYIEARARVAGQLAGVRFGESFQTSAPIRVNTLSDVVTPRTK